MSPNRRIFLNIVATYGRSLYALVLGLFTGRWVLMALGQVDYGLYGLVGGLAIFISFFNGLLSGAIARFYAFEIGRSQSASDAIAALEECRKWFNTALLIHTVVPVFCIVLGYPVGIWAIHNFLNLINNLHCGYELVRGNTDVSVNIKNGLMKKEKCSNHSLTYLS